MVYVILQQIINIRVFILQYGIKLHVSFPSPPLAIGQELGQPPPWPASPSSADSPLPLPFFSLVVGLWLGFRQTY
jgi:hypothetical protein